MKDGDLRKKILKQKNLGTRFQEETVAEWSHEMVEGIYFLHNNSIIHRDIKPEFVISYFIAVNLSSSVVYLNWLKKISRYLVRGGQLRLEILDDW